ncbi:hypothetical protein BRADI_5g04683v3 [Brachypodium distachyon]|uniref:Uncharacterized protein n=1 Tax=Brachypodium distachyon TaxID=15368 RepID=A0A2K2CFG2_BRADI|nr:hypothetical protein BRADI_5g04683v3 [Brachypodium distachyon]
MSILVDLYVGKLRVYVLAISSANKNTWDTIYPSSGPSEGLGFSHRR